MSKELTMGVIYDQVQQHKKELIENLAASSRPIYTDDIYEAAKVNYGFDKFDTVEVGTTSITLDVVLGTDFETGENRNMLIPKHLMPEKVVRILEPFDMGNGLHDAVRDTVLNQVQGKELPHYNHTSNLISGSIDRIDSIDKEHRFEVPNDQELAASLAIDIIGEDNFIIPTQLIVDGELFDILSKMDISQEISHDFKQQRIDKFYENNIQLNPENIINSNTIVNRIENGRKVPVTDPSEREGVLKAISEATGLKFE